MERKYTKGPWVAMNGTDVFTSLGATNASGTKADDDDAWHIADCSAGETFVDGFMESMMHSETMANARLISAAPELFDALDELANGYAGNRWDVGLGPRLAKARAALKKALGETE